MEGHAPVAPRQPRHDTLRVLTPAEREKVQGHARMTLRGDFDASIYNGSNCVVTLPRWFVDSLEGRCPTK